MACRLIGAKPLFEQMSEYLIWPLGTNLSEMLDEIQTFLF